MEARVSADLLGALAGEAHQAPASPRSAPTSLLHPWKSSGDAITAHFHATQHSKRRYRYARIGALVRNDVGPLLMRPTQQRAAGRLEALALLPLSRSRGFDVRSAARPGAGVSGATAATSSPTSRSSVTSAVNAPTTPPCPGLPSRRPARWWLKALSMARPAVAAGPQCDRADRPAEPPVRTPAPRAGRLLTVIVGRVLRSHVAGERECGLDRHVTGSVAGALPRRMPEPLARRFEEASVDAIVDGLL